MTLRSRRILFYCLVFIFIAVGTGVILYAMGIRVNRNTFSFSFSSRGGMYIVSSPSNAKIMIDGKEVKANSGLFQSGTLVNGLTPKSHVLELSAPGYKPWRRTVSVSPSKVADIQYAVLTPESPIGTLATGVKDLWQAQGTSVLLQYQDGSLSLQNRLLTGISSSSLPFTWNDARTQFLAILPRISGYRATRFGLVDISTPAAATSTILTPLINKVEGNPVDFTVKLDPSYEDRAIVSSPFGIWLLDTRTSTATNIETSTSTSYFGQSIPLATSRDMIALGSWNQVSSTQNILVYDRSAKTSRLLDISTMPSLLQGIGSLHFENNGLLSIGAGNGDFYTYDFDKNVFAKRGAHVRQALFSPDDRMLALLEDDSLEVFSIGTTDYARFNLKNVRDVQNLVWHKNDHTLFITYPDHVTVLDVGDSLQEAVTEIPAQKNIYDSGANKLYALNSGTVSVYQFSND
jgi:PEGA domain